MSSKLEIMCMSSVVGHFHDKFSASFVFLSNVLICLNLLNISINVNTKLSLRLTVSDKN